MGRRLDSFPGQPLRPQRKYPWGEWTDGSAWEIRRGDDYDIATENMRVNLHMKADALGRKVRTNKFRDEHGEGLIFQFLEAAATGTGHPNGTDSEIELLYRDAVGIYDRARREVTIERKDGRRQKYAANRYKQQIDRAYADRQLVPAVGRIVSRRTQGFGHLEDAGRPDLMVETLVLDTGKPYHHLFPAATIHAARDRMAQYKSRHP